MKKSTINIRNTPPLKSKPSQTLLAGSATVDITPPPGMPLAGFSMFSCTAFGVRTKLKARIFYIKPKTGGAVALVQCDLLSGSLLIHHRVAELVAPETDIEAGAILISGTHTHSGPGNFFENKMYNDNASNKPGLEEKYVDFCVKQIAEGIMRAREERKPARIATGETEVYGATINRALPPYLINDTIKNLKKKPDALKAINPKLYMIRVDVLEKEQVHKPLGAFTSFSIHPNTNPAELGGLYNGDITGFVTREVEAEIKKKYKTSWNPVLAAANGTHGDCNANHSQDRVENFKDQKKLARLISDKTLDLFYSLDQRLKSDVNVGFRAREINMLETSEIDGIHISDRGYVGMSTPAGALGRGRITSFNKVWLFRAGRPKRFFTKGSQGHKRILLGPLQSLILPKEDFGHILFAQIIRIADVLLIPLPWEVTQEMGRRIGDSAKTMGEDAGLKGIKKVVVLDTSNGYIGYLTTPEEYTLQYYEGGSNVYGPNTGPYVGSQVAHVAKDLASKGSGSDLPEKWEFSLPAKSYYPENRIATGKRTANKDPKFTLKGELKESFWSFKWYDVPPSDIEFHNPLITIETSQNKKDWTPLEIDGVSINDEGADISIIYQSELSHENMGLYEVRWNNPMQNGNYYRFKILPRGNQDVFYSAAFR
ncbi:neutral/alkaline non-lysosomal ceramidase N-terminal domain-containing protein [bacterium]|nr:neutral/alkaline non-lysosomal ceramidase N-terminal domain-containing protein [bacterium]